jgi:glycosyltransferase involved in cell wall biosynthesis
VIADSDRMADIYKKEFNSSSVTIAYGANIANSSSPQLIANLGIKPNDYYLIVGRLVPDNNGDIIVKGFEQSKTQKKLVILGDVPYKDEYSDRIHSTKDSRIIFPGYIRDEDVLRELYCNSYAYIHGHEYGGTNPSLLKALACGNCILALDTIFSREVLKGDEYGLYFLKDPESVKNLINRVDIDESLVKSFRSKARRRIQERYTWEMIADQYENLCLTMAVKK